MTVGSLRNAQRAYARAAKAYERTRVRRNTLVTLAFAEGWTHAAIAQATGLTRGRVGQIAHPSRGGSVGVTCQTPLED